MAQNLSVQVIKKIMKKIILSAALILGSGAVIISTTQSCMAIATSSIGLTIIKQILLGGITKGLGILKNKDSFLANNLIDQAMPKTLRDINGILEKIAPNLVAKEKDYIAQAAAFTANLAEPILVNAVNSLNAEDVTRIANGGSGIATQILKEKTATQLVSALTPKVDEKLNQFGIVRTINLALQGSNLLSGIFGGQQTISNYNSSGGLSKLASEMMVNGLFNIIEDYEQQNSGKLLEAIKQ